MAYQVVCSGSHGPSDVSHPGLGGDGPGVLTDKQQGVKAHCAPRRTAGVKSTGSMSGCPGVNQVSPTSWLGDRGQFESPSLTSLLEGGDTEGSNSASLINCYREDSARWCF